MASGVTPKQIYTALTGAGASTTQAIGIMANMIAESGLDPEAVGDQGTSFGLVQQHGMQYAGLVSGNPGNDMAAQIKTLATNGGIGAAAGSTGAQAAGNFAANYERCVGCQQGGAQYNQRVANAATVAGWVSSGNWPASAGSASSAAAGGSSSTTASGNNTSPECAFGTGAINLHLSSIPPICIVKKTTLRHLVGGVVIGGGGIVLLVGAVVLAASAFQRSGAQQAVNALPGAGRVTGALREGITGRQARAQQEKEDQRILRVARTAKQSRPYGPTKENPTRTDQ